MFWIYIIMSKVDIEIFSTAYEHTNRIVVFDHDDFKVFDESQCVNISNIDRFVNWLFHSFNENEKSKDIIDDNEDISRMRVEEEMRKWITICKEYFHEWERLWNILRDVRTNMIRSKLWKKSSKELKSRNFRSESSFSIESDQEHVDEATIETRFVSCIQIRRYTSHNYHKNKLRIKADWLRKVVFDASVKKKFIEDRKSKIMNVRQRQIAHSFQKQSEIIK